MSLRIGWFTTARGPGSRTMYAQVAEAIESGGIDAQVAVVFCNREPGEAETTDGFFDLVHARGHPLVTRSSVRYRRAVGGKRSRPGEPLPPWRMQYDRLIDADLASHPFDVGVLAGYMLIFAPEFVTRHPILNLHPALPDGPVGTWREVIRSLIRMGARESGVMIHLAIAEVDRGPVVAFCRYPLHDGALEPLWASTATPIRAMDDAALEATDLFAAIRARGMAYESPLLIATLDALASGSLRVPDVSRAQQLEPLDLTEAVVARLHDRAT